MVDEESEVVRELRELIADGIAVMIGPIRQELLSGIRHRKQFTKLSKNLRAFPDLTLEEADFERAAEYFTTCNKAGIQGSNTDFLICAVAERRELSIFTTDDDFVRISEQLPIRLHRTRFGWHEAGPRSCLRLTIAFSVGTKGRRTQVNVDARR